ncbi:hypothetical protein AX16_003003 [Volvariella volvacea WC 439]|nr:hypothetical protein AX16_003003 [Volvariella volvacea WC 439]
MQTTSGSIVAHVLGVEYEETQPCPCGQGLPPIVLVTSTDSGSVSITMPGFQERWRPPIHSYATSNAGSIRVTLPESFQGLVKIHKVPGMRIETGLQQLQDGDAKYDVFCVGSGPCDEGSKCEKCDQVVIKSSGGEVKVSYSEDVVLEATMHR